MYGPENVIERINSNEIVSEKVDDFKVLGKGAMVLFKNEVPKYVISNFFDLHPIDENGIIGKKIGTINLL